MLKNNLKLIIPFVEIFSKVISFINVLLLMNLLLIDDYANYSYIMAIVLWASVLMDGGINNLVFNNSLKNNLTNTNTLFSARFVLSLIIILSLTVFFILTKPQLTVSAILYSTIIFISSSSAFIKMLSRGKGYVKVDITVILSEPLLRLLILLLALLIFKNLQWELWILLLVYLIASVLSFGINYYKLSKYIKIKINVTNFKLLIQQIKTTLKDTKFYLFYYLLFIGIGRIDVIFIETYTTKTDLALYSSAMTLFGVVQLFFFSLITSQFKKIYKNQKKSIILLSIVLGVISLITVMISQFLFSTLFQEDYYLGYKILNRMIFALIPSVSVYYFITKFNFENKTKINSYILLLPLIFKITFYSFIKSSSIEFYSNVFTFTEYLILICYIIYFLFHENTSNKQIPIS